MAARTPIADGQREARLAAQLRANLLKRKRQARGDALPADDQRASASDPIDVAAPAA